MNKHIMIVDDNRDILDMLKDALEELSFRVTALSYTDDIVKDITKYSPDLVILDFLLAGINGGEHCHQIKNDSLTAHLPVIILSGFPRVLESLGNYGADIFIEKPFDLERLTSAINNCLEGTVKHNQFEHH